jgi:hypothetical protein
MRSKVSDLIAQTRSRFPDKSVGETFDLMIHVCNEIKAEEGEYLFTIADRRKISDPERASSFSRNAAAMDG